MQQVRAAQERNRNYRAVVHLSDKRFVQLATPDLPNVNPGDDPTRAIGTSDLPYQQEISWDTTYNDVYLVDLKTGTRKKVLEHFSGASTLSPGGKYLLYFDETAGDWFTYDIADGTRINLTERLPVKFFDESHDTPDLPPSLGIGRLDRRRQDRAAQRPVRHLGNQPDGTSARMVTERRGPQAAPRVPVSHRSIRTQRTIPTTSRCCCRRPTTRRRRSGYYRVPT